MTNASEKSHVLTRPEIIIINSFTAIALIYCAASAYLFHTIVHQDLVKWVHVLACIVIIVNYLILLKTQNFRLATHIMLATGTAVVTSLFATGGWEMTGFLWPFAYLPYAFFLATGGVVVFWVALLYALSLSISLLAMLGIIFVPYSTIQLGNYLAALAVFIACMFFVVRAQRHYVKYMHEKESELLQVNEKLLAEVSAKKTARETLEKQTGDLKRVNDLLVGRELKMKELKTEIEELKQKLVSTPTT